MAPKKSGQLNNHVTRFGKFTWGEDERLRKKLEELSRQIGPQPVRLKVNLAISKSVRLGKETLKSK